MNQLSALQVLVNDFAAVQRSHYIPLTNTRENDIHHSFSVGMLAWMIHDKLQLHLDMTKVMHYAMAHDLVEVYAGDVNTYANEQVRNNKKSPKPKHYLRSKLSLITISQR